MPRSNSNDDSKSGKSKVVWTADDDDALLKAVLLDRQGREAATIDNAAEVGDTTEDEEDWDAIAEAVPGKTPVHCLKRYLFLNSSSGSGSNTGSPIPAPATASAGVKEEKEDATEDSKPAAHTKTKGTTKKRKQDEDDDEDEEEDDAFEHGAKRVKMEEVEPSSLVPWSEGEVELLKKLVEQYKDCKFADRQSGSVDSLSLSDTQ